MYSNFYVDDGLKFVVKFVEVIDLLICIRVMLVRVNFCLYKIVFSYLEVIYVFLRED